MQSSLDLMVIPFGSNVKRLLLCRFLIYVFMCHQVDESFLFTVRQNEQHVFCYSYLHMVGLVRTFKVDDVDVMFTQTVGLWLYCSRVCAQIKLCYIISCAAHVAYMENIIPSTHFYSKGHRDKLLSCTPSEYFDLLINNMPASGLWTKTGVPVENPNKERPEGKPVCPEVCVLSSCVLCCLFVSSEQRTCDCAFKLHGGREMSSGGSGTSVWQHWYNQTQTVCHLSSYATCQETAEFSFV